MNSTQERVSKGAAFLDRVVPDWRDRVDVDSLSMVDYDRCVVGQILGVRNQEHGAYDQFLRENGILYYDHYLYGFDRDKSDSNDFLSRDAQWEELNAAWVIEIRGN